MKKYFKYIIVTLLVVVSAITFSSYDKVDETKEINSSYNITRVHYDMMYDMKIYEVKTPRGTFFVLWEETKGGLCVLK